jgi:hypothetical protein
MRRIALVLLLGLLLAASPLVHTTYAQPTGQITSPRDNAAVRGLVPIEGSASHPQFQKYEVHYGSQPNPGDQWTPVGGSPFSVPVVQGRMGSIACACAWCGWTATMTSTMCGGS